MGLSDNMQPATWAISIPFIVITGITCLLRFYSRLYISKSFGADDWFMVAASVSWLVTEGILCQMITDGGGRVDAPAENIAKITMLLLIIEFVYILTQLLIKLSFLTFYLRVLSGSPAYRLMVFCAMGFTLAQTVAVWLFYGLQCIPLGTFFNPSAYPEGHCIPTPLTLYIPASLNVLTDLIIYLLPIYPVWTLQMSKKRRLGLIFCFTIGGGTIIVSVLRFIVLVQLASGSRTTYVYGSVDIVTTIELSIAIITGNMPSMVSIYKQHVMRIHDQSSDGKPSPYELGTMSRSRSRRTPAKGSVALKSREADNESEEELCNKGEIMVTSHFNVTSSQNSRPGDTMPSSYYKFTSESPTTEIDVVR
ncbi:hypothetical protein DTO166G4_6113 [Paecilomyces variotii]|nr:hypothetical protein DTO164E3_2702 [Paecilomyces variotii]KAJ9212331.1 hypothetical protein DTO166G4_6113 [Paecilomyces variotii]KAJ9235319.1 hypothetical protein DTO166G5_4600 [Paecilomyces variotii]KAJ9362113.1 hypothetical protein DTO027B9_544 [Paecilomyces variotii]